MSESLLPYRRVLGTLSHIVSMIDHGSVRIARSAAVEMIEEIRRVQEKPVSETSQSEDSALDEALAREVDLANFLASEIAAGSDPNHIAANVLVMLGRKGQAVKTERRDPVIFWCCGKPFSFKDADRHGEKCVEPNRVARPEARAYIQQAIADYDAGEIAKARDIADRHGFVLVRHAEQALRDASWSDAASDLLTLAGTGFGYDLQDADRENLVNAAKLLDPQSVEAVKCDHGDHTVFRGHKAAHGRIVHGIHK